MLQFDIAVPFCLFKISLPVIMVVNLPIPSLFVFLDFFKNKQILGFNNGIVLFQGLHLNINYDQKFVNKMWKISKEDWQP